jgi:hypothetical protein
LDLQKSPLRIYSLNQQLVNDSSARISDIGGLYSRNILARAGARVGVTVPAPGTIDAPETVGTTPWPVFGSDLTSCVTNRQQPWPIEG